MRLTLMIFMQVTAAAHHARAAELSGVVLGPGGAFVKGAVVDIWTAAPVDGTGSICPSCYVDCTKQAITDAEGKFRIPLFRDDLALKLLVYTPGFEPEFFSDVRPSGNPWSLELAREPMAVDCGKSFSNLRIHVASSNGDRLPGCRVTIRGMGREPYDTIGPLNTRERHWRVTDGEGMAVFPCLDEETFYSFDVEHVGFAAQRFVAREWPGRAIQVEINRGATISGRTVQVGEDGATRPLANVVIIPENETGPFVNLPKAVSDAEGRYTLRGLPAHASYVLSGNSYVNNRLAYDPPTIRVWDLALGENRTAADLVFPTVSERRSIAREGFPWPREGEPYDFYAKTLDGRAVDGRALRGKVVLIAWWATWCPPCLETIPKIRKLSLEHQDSDFVVLGVNMDHSLEAADRAVKKYDVNWPVVTMPTDAQGRDRWIKRAGVFALPRYFVLNRDGELISDADWSKTLSVVSRLIEEGGSIEKAGLIDP